MIYLLLVHADCPSRNLSEARRFQESDETTTEAERPRASQNRGQKQQTAFRRVTKAEIRGAV